jgi:MYXO-CTERM domain-containing protein
VSACRATADTQREALVDGGLPDGGVADGGVADAAAGSDAAVGPDGGAEPPANSGCGCVVPGGSRSDERGGLALLTLDGLVLVRRRRR